jgi:hypothetical protein
MKLYVGITDTDWFRYLRQRNAEEMSFGGLGQQPNSKFSKQASSFCSNQNTQKKDRGRCILCQALYTAA